MNNRVSPWKEGPCLQFQKFPSNLEKIDQDFVQNIKMYALYIYIYILIYLLHPILCAHGTFLQFFCACYGNKILISKWKSTCNKCNIGPSSRDALNCKLYSNTNFWSLLRDTRTGTKFYLDRLRGCDYQFLSWVPQSIEILRINGKKISFGAKSWNSNFKVHQYNRFRWAVDRQALGTDIMYEYVGLVFPGDLQYKRNFSSFWVFLKKKKKNSRTWFSQCTS